MTWSYEIRAAAEPRKAEVAIFGEIGESWFDETVTARKFVAEFAAIDADEITIRINSHGGSVVDGLAIYNAIRRHPAKTVASVEGVAASIASYISMAADVRRIAANALYMMHGAWTVAAGNSKKMREVADVLDLHSSSMAAGYASASGKSLDAIKALLTDGQDHWYSAAEAVAEGYFHESGEAVEAVASVSPAAARNYAPTLFPAVTAASIPKGTTMPDPNPAPAVAAAPAPATPEPAPLDEAGIRAAALRAESERRQEVRAVFSRFEQHEGIPALRDAAVDDHAVTVAVARERLLAHLGAQAQPIAGGAVVTVEDETDKRMQGMVASLMIRAGVAPSDMRKAHGGNPWRGNTLVDMARASLIRAGINPEGLDRMQIVGLAFTQSTSDFPILLENVLHKTLQQAYALAPDTWSRFCATGSVSDFRAHKRYRTGSIGNLDPVNELGEFESKAIPDGESDSITASTRGNIINISRQTIINDDLGAFTSLASSLGRAARRTIEAAVYARLAENSGNGPTLEDGNPLFHASHGNLVSSGPGAPTVAQFDAMRVLMAQQKDVGGNDYLDLRPAIWLGPLSLRGAAVGVNEAEYDDEATKNQRRPNISRGLVRDIVDTPRLTGNAYYMFADPNEAPAMEVAFLDGNSEPFLESQAGFTVDGTAWKVRLDFGVAPRDYRGAVKNPGQ